MRKSICRWNHQFEQTGYLCKDKSSGRPRVSEKNVRRIQESFELSPRKSTHRASRELGIPQTTVWRVLRRRLLFKPYRLTNWVHLFESRCTFNSVVSCITLCAIFFIRDISAPLLANSSGFSCSPQTFPNVIWKGRYSAPFGMLALWLLCISHDTYWQTGAKMFCKYSVLVQRIHVLKLFTMLYLKGGLLTSGKETSWKNKHVVVNIYFKTCHLCDWACWSILLTSCSLLSDIRAN